MVKIALICSILAVTAVSAQQTMSEGDSCNESLPPRYAKRCDRDQGLVCRTVSMVMGASGKCVKGGSISRNTIKLGGRCSTSRTRGNRGRITPCESGYVCKITNKGDMRVDRPNSGLCVAKRGGPPRLSGGLQVDPGFGRVTQRAARMCPNSARQMCKMLCRPKVCPQGQCAMRQGSCCDMTCVGGH